MFEKEAEETFRKNYSEYCCRKELLSPYWDLWQDGAEFGYNKANEWQFVSEKGLPKESGRYLVYVGGGEKGVYPLDFDTEYNDFGYWCLQVGESLGVSDTVFETVTERKEDKVLAWKEIIPPSLDKEKAE